MYVVRCQNTCNSEFFVSLRRMIIAVMNVFESLGDVFISWYVSSVFILTLLLLFITAFLDFFCKLKLLLQCR